MNYYDKTAEKGIYYGNLPHWRQNTVCYFVTFRAADSIPQIKLQQWIQERDEWQQEHPEPLSENDKDEYHRRFSHTIEHWLDGNYGQCLLASDRCKEIMFSALLFFHEKRYRLWEYVVAPNHVHLLIEPLCGNQLEDIMHSIKSYTAKEINKETGNAGHFWQKEYFDHIVRSEEHYQKYVTYIRNHTVEASS